MHVLVFEDSQVDRLRPLCLFRPIFSVACGGRCLLDQLGRLGGHTAAVVRPYLQELITADHPDLLALDQWHEGALKSQGLTLLINARLVPSASAREELEGLIDAGKPGIVSSRTGIAAVLCRGDTLPSLAELEFGKIVGALADAELPSLNAGLPLFEYPHDIVRFHLATMAENLADLVAQGSYRKIADGVFAAGDIAASPQVFFDTARGPIVLEEGVKIGPFSVLQGPLHAGRGAIIREHSSIRDFTTLGEQAKVGGEVLASIIESFSNKQHDGFLGHSYVGRWVNLGAGTCTSDLKNTYGQINVQHEGKKIATGMQFFGTIIGDFAKTAINATIFTGKSISAASMVYGTVAENVPSFINYAKSFGQVTIASVEVVAKMQQRMFERREREQRPCDLAVLNAAFAITEPERRDVATVVGPPKF